MSIQARGITKRFGDFTALGDVSLDVPTGELVALLGPSGSGKTTLLRIIAGLEFADEGAVLFDGEDATARRVRERRVGFVFQHYALFRHMTVFENVAFGLRVRPRRARPTKAEIRDRVEKLLGLVQIERLGARYPSELSGGQRQRVALARALAVEPKVLLLDEPFGSLDAKVRGELRRWLRRLHDEIHITSVFVTHDQEEALEVADRIVVMNQGRIEQYGTPDDVFHHPTSEFVMDFLGNVNIFHGRSEAGKVVFGPLVLDHPQAEQPDGRPARLLVRSQDLSIHADAPDGPGLRARVQYIQTAGPQVKIELVTETGEIANVMVPHDAFREMRIAKGDEVFVGLRDARVFVEDYSI